MEKKYIYGPIWRVGESFVSELARLFRSYGESTSLESLALMAAMTIPSLLLQKPYPNSKSKDHVCCLQKHLDLWGSGKLSELITEGRCIQQRLISLKKAEGSEDEKFIRSFSALMRQGKVKAVLRVLSKGEGMVLDVNSTLETDCDNGRTVLDELKTKHPPKGPFYPEAISEHKTKEFHPIIFDCIDGDAIQHAALNTNEAAGPSGLDAKAWRRLCT